MHLYPGEILYIFILGISLYFVLKRQLFAPIGKIIQDREDTIEGAKGFIAEARDEIEEIHKKREEEISEATNNAYEIEEKARSEGYEKRKDIIDTAQTEAYEKLRQVRDEIKIRSQEVQSSLRKEANKFAVEIAEIMLGREI
jgi:F-type H+-transporting ATPase subunit b